ncbi:MAG: hypothetical protein ABSF46_29980 [Terriglobia bacterium]
MASSASRIFSAFYDPHEKVGFEVVQLLNQRGLVRYADWPAALVKIEAHPLLSASYSEQFTIERDIPYHVEPLRGKSLVERHAMTVPFRVR